MLVEALRFLIHEKMTTMRFLYLFSIALATLATACNYDDQVLPLQPNDQEIYFSISGRVFGNGIDVSGISISDGNQTTLTDSNGIFVLSNLPKGIYLISPRKPGLMFIPPSISVHIDNHGEIRQDFTATMPLIEMVKIPGGSFIMGSFNGNSNERPPHEVVISTFEIGKYEVTQRLWSDLMSTRPSTFQNDDGPIENVSWFDAAEFCNALSTKNGLTPAYTITGNTVACDFNTNGYRLPTEAEWEYACRAGTTTDRYSGNMSSTSNQNFFEPNLDTIAWYKFNSGGTTHSVGLKAPNIYGLYDMQGNVTEWCWDFWRNTYQNDPQVNPTGPSTGTAHALRGGSWFDVQYEVRSAFHRSYSPSSKYSGVGFRVARTVR